jgi:glycosyltransferase involved in cell wall biosynthesis
MPTISIIHPSRGRAQQSFNTISKWIAKAGMTDFEIILSIDRDDPQIGKYYELYQNLNHPFLWDDNTNKNAVEAINRGAREANGNIFIVVSDDTDCPGAWATKILRYTQGKSDFVLKVRDGIQPRMITMPIVDRVYYQRDGYIYHPRFSHCWADRFFTEVAYKRKRVIEKPIMFRHLHYSVSKSKKRDSQYERTDATFNEGKIIYNELIKQI